MKPWHLQRILPEQHLLEDEESWQGILRYIPDEDVRAKLHGRWSSGRQAVHGDINTFRWLDLVAEVDKVRSLHEALPLQERSVRLQLQKPTCSMGQRFGLASCRLLLNSDERPPAWSILVCTCHCRSLHQISVRLTVDMLASRLVPVLEKDACWQSGCSCHSALLLQSYLVVI